MMLASGAGHYQCPDGQVIFNKGEEGDVVYVIEKGSVQILLPQQSAEDIPLTTLYPGDIFGELALLDTGPRSATVVALEPVEAVMIRRNDFLAFLRKQPEAAIRILAVLAARLRRTDELLGQAASDDIPARLAKHLLTLAQPMDPSPQEGMAPPRVVSRRQLTRAMGGAKTSLDLYLRLLQDQGVLHCSRDRVVILRPEALEALAR